MAKTHPTRRASGAKATGDSEPHGFLVRPPDLYIGRSLARPLVGTVREVRKILSSVVQSILRQTYWCEEGLLSVSLGGLNKIFLFFYVKAKDVVFVAMAVCAMGWWLLWRGAAENKNPQRVCRESGLLGRSLVLQRGLRYWFLGKCS